MRAVSSCLCDILEIGLDRSYKLEKSVRSFPILLRGGALERLPEKIIEALEANNKVVRCESPPPSPSDNLSPVLPPSSPCTPFPSTLAVAPGAARS